MEYTNEQLTEAIELNLKGITRVYKIAKKCYNNIFLSTEDKDVTRRASLLLVSISTAMVETLGLLEKVEKTERRSERTLLRRTADSLLRTAISNSDTLAKLNLKCSKSK